jgi:hypothetical protein
VLRRAPSRHQARGDAHDLLRRLGGDFLDVHAARGAGHHHRLAGGAVEQHAQVELALHLEALFDQDASHNPPFGAGLMGDERHAEHLDREVFGLVRRLGQLDAAALAAAAGVDLRLDDDDRGAETPGNVAGLGGRKGHFAAGHGDAVLRQNRFRLILVDFHRGRNGSMLTCAFLRRNSKLIF